MQHRLIQELQSVVSAAGMMSYVPDECSYRFSEAESEEVLVVPLSRIRPPFRNDGVECINAERGAQILKGIKSDNSIPPVLVHLLNDAQSPYRYCLDNGFHRFHISSFLGFSHIPVVIRPIVDFNVL